MNSDGGKQGNLFQKSARRKRPKAPSLGGQNHAAVDPVLDRPRLSTQFWKVVGDLSDKQWHTQFEIAARHNIPQGSVGSQIRNARCDGYIIEKVRVGAGGTWAYRLVGKKGDQL